MHTYPQIITAHLVISKTLDINFHGIISLRLKNIQPHTFPMLTDGFLPTSACSYSAAQPGHQHGVNLQQNHTDLYQYVILLLFTPLSPCLDAGTQGGFTRIEKSTLKIIEANSYFKWICSAKKFWCWSAVYLWESISVLKWTCINSLPPSLTSVLYMLSAPQCQQQTDQNLNLWK